MAYFTTAQLADRYGVDDNKIRVWIESGELKAINLAQSADGKRPRWRVTEQAVADFEASRSSTPVQPAPRKRRRREVASGREWF